MDTRHTLVLILNSWFNLPLRRAKMAFTEARRRAAWKSRIAI